MIPQRAGEPSDEEVINLVLEGDREAFSILLLRHRSKVYRLGMSFFHDREDADDFTQDVFVKAYTALGTFKGRSAFSTWLLRIAYNTAINAVRKRRDDVAIGPDDELFGEGGTDEGHERAVAIEAVRAAMASLPPKQAVCIELYFYYDLKYSEISEITGFPVNTIKSHVFRAKKILRDKLGADMEADHEV
jgi:RNA polymerase sigma-70 factor, ECF subfamily